MRVLKLIQIVEIANKKFPFDCSEPWDNSGIQVGNLDREIGNIAFSLDANPVSIQFAKQNSCELLITHHPILINPLKNILASDLTGETIMFAIRSNVDVLSLHTNLDAAQGGLNDYLAGLLELNSVMVPEHAGCSRVGIIDDPITLSDFNELVKRRFVLENTTMICSDENKLISRIFLASGSGSSYLPYAACNKVEVMVTGDVKYHVAVDAQRMGISIIDAGHFGMEKHSIRLMADSFRKEFERMGINVMCHECPDEKDPFVHH